MTSTEFYNRIKLALESAKVNHHNDALEDMLMFAADLMEQVNKYGDPRSRELIKERLCIIANGDHFNEDLAILTVSKMNYNNIVGEQVSMHNCKIAASNHNVTFDTFNEYDWYVAVNMMYVYHFNKNHGIATKHRTISIDELMIEDAKCFLKMNNIYKHYKNTLKCNM